MNEEKKKRGFAAMTPEQQREIAAVMTRFEVYQQVLVQSLRGSASPQFEIELEDTMKRDDDDVGSISDRMQAKAGAVANMADLLAREAVIKCDAFIKDEQERIKARKAAKGGARGNAVDEVDEALAVPSKGEIDK